MRTLLAVVALLLAAPLLAACGGEGDTTATDPAAYPGATSGRSMPTEIPAARGPVHTAGIATVLDREGPELCLGPVAESWPPQCHGPRIVGWDWRDQQGIFEHQQGVRWGSFWVAGTWDGTTFTYRDAIPSALYDPMPTEPSPLPDPAVRHSPVELEDIAGEVGGLPGVLSVYTDDGHVLLDVVYDDGSLQAWADDTYGADVVVLRPALLDD